MIELEGILPYVSKRVDEIIDLQRADNVKYSSNIICDGKDIFVFKYDDRTFDVYDLETLEHKNNVDLSFVDPSFKHGPAGRITHVVFSNDNKYFIFAHTSGLVRFVDVESLITVSVVRVCEGLTHAYDSLYIVNPEPPSTYIVAARIHKSFYVIDTDCMSVVAEVGKYCALASFPVTFLGESKIMYSQYGDSFASIFDTRNGSTYTAVPIYKDDVQSVAVDNLTNEVYVSNRYYIEKYKADCDWNHFQKCKHNVKAGVERNILIIRGDYCVVVTIDIKTTKFRLLDRNSMNPVCTIYLNKPITLFCVTPDRQYLVVTMQDYGSTYIGKVDIDHLIHIAEDVKAKESGK
jgi:WD40 repeat protein